MKVELNADACIGAGQCVLAAPAVFEQDEDDGIAFVSRKDVSPSEKESVREASRRCPARAILVEE